MFTGTVQIICEFDLLCAWMLLRRGALSAHAVGKLQKSGTILRTETSRYGSVLALTGVCQGGVNQQSGKLEAKDVKLH
jgi:hypothetical protein